jgi:AbiV family abortive infection protein
MVADEEPSLETIVQHVISHAHAAEVTPPSPDELKAIAERAMRALCAKDGVRRFKLSMRIMSELLEGPALLQGSQEQRDSDWVRCASSVAALWLTAVDAWRCGSPSVAVALSITCLEETGKLAVERWRLWGATSIIPPPDTEWNRRRLFRDHMTKHVLAAMSGALINARLDRVLGTEFVILVLDKAEAGQLAKFREDCLYLDRKHGVLHVPAESVTSELAAQYVALSGEVLAEILPDPAAWSRFLERVQEFEQSAGIDPS